jgi:quinol monooxygenase YgiN
MRSRRCSSNRHKRCRAAADADALWITEVWDSAANHQASLSLPAVKATIAKARPLIAGFSNRVETVPIGGYGLAKTAAD